MSGGFPVLRLYRRRSGTEASHVLCCVRHPDYRGWSTDDEGAAARLLEHAVESLLAGSGVDPSTLTLIGEQQGYPVGDRLFETPAPERAMVSYAFLRSGGPWIVLGLDVEADDFWGEVSEDEDLRALDPVPPLSTVPAVVLAEL
ncbi:hypothetical protein EGT67_24285 [Prescottella agglutinans]|uniref:Uncharacterized protein n=1 Tax=Prescottella agglutinans TaxID=1644129 RepID=A0A438B7E2_9NOCA|nr:hypothetical protein EGT67_24285 [Prescottella agglutinans]